MKIAVVGTGYVGLVTGACLAYKGIETVCIDIDEEKINNLKSGKATIYEPGIEEIMASAMQDNNLSFTTNIEDGIKGRDAVFIAVGTPSDKDGSADLKYVVSVARDIGRYINNYMVVITKSTVPVGTSELVKNTIQEEIKRRGINVDFDVASNPEFLKEGSAVKDFLNPDRIVVGIDSNRAKAVLEEIYKPFTEGGYRLIVMDIPSAEMTKYAANAMLATRISFMNEIANLCERVGANIEAVKEGVGSDPRIGRHFLNAGIGYGGSCFPKDVKALIKKGNDAGVEMKILKAVESVNQSQKLVIVKKILNRFGNIDNMTFALWGLAFKPETDDMREAPSIYIVEELLKHGASIKAYDPQAIENAKKIIGDKIVYCSDKYQALSGSDVLIIATEWKEFKEADISSIKSSLSSPIVFDGRNIFDPRDMKEAGIEYHCIGISTNS